MSSRLSQFMEARTSRRRAINFIACTSLGLLSGLAIGVLFLVFGYILSRGFPALDLNFFIQLPKPVGESGGGMANAILGTIVLVGLASLLGIPWGVFTGIYLSEYGKGRFGTAVRFSADMLSSVPSIVVGLFAYAILVVPMRRFSAIAGGFSLAIMMVPLIARTTEEILRLVPTHIREAGLALGLPRWKVILGLVLKGCSSGILTGIMLAIARTAGETAPLLFTAFGNQYFQTRLDQPISSLPVQIFTYAIAPFDDWHRQAWSAALVLVCLVFTLNILARIVFRAPDARRG